ncbi:heme exporter protein CcmD [Pelagibacterium sp.]|uniref:heme exporter protein CcmD n=1 Tax=Pelagibacterium sp. TaxID=1967288 RepID=UPI003C7E209B
MIDLGQHWEFIAAAYAGTIVVVGGLIGWTVFSARAAKTRVEVLETARRARRQQ